MLNLVKYRLFKDACKLKTLFSFSKNKAKICNTKSTATSFENLTDRVRKFIQLDPSVSDLSRIDEGKGIIQTLTTNNPFYHKGCYDNFNNSNYERLVKKVQEQWPEDSFYSAPTIPRKRKKTEIRKVVCLFCDIRDYTDKLTPSGEYDSGSNNPDTKHVESLTEN